MKKICCIFNYAPLYREAIYKRIDDEFDTQFVFGREVLEGIPSGIEKLNYNIFRRPPIEVLNRKVWKFSWRTGICKLPLNSYDAFVITADFPLSYFPFLFLCKFLRKPVYAWGHGPKQKGKLIGRLFNGYLLSMVTKFLCYGEKGRDRMIQLGYPAKKLDVIYNSLGARNNKSQALLSEVYHNHFSNNNPVLIFTGRLTPQKKLEGTLTAIKNLKDRGVNCNLMLIGDGPERETLKRLSEEFDIKSQVWFYGKCYDETILNELIYNADLCIAPGEVGLTALHAMEYGVPVISHGDFDTQMPEYETIVPMKTGQLFEKGNMTDFESKIEEWLKFANGRREEIRQNCYDMINGKWNIDNQIEILKRIINEQ